MALRRLAVALLLVTAVAAHGHHRHLLAPGTSKTNGQGKGPKFDFPKGTGRAFLDNMDQAQLQKILEKAHFSDKSALARELENDADLVSTTSRSVHASCLASSLWHRSCFLSPSCSHLTQRGIYC
jgi:hypothetical protein